MTRKSWRVDVMSDGATAWVFVRPHAVAWSVPAASVTALGYTVTEERQNLVDEQLGACIRYLAVKVGEGPRHPEDKFLADLSNAVGPEAGRGEVKRSDASISHSAPGLDLTA